MVDVVDEWFVETELDNTWDFYTRANVGEVFPDPVAPLSFEWFEDENGIGHTERGFRQAYYRFGCLAEDEFPPDRSTILGVFGGYCYLNAAAMRMIGHRTDGMKAEDIDDVFFGGAPGVPPFVAQPHHDRPDLTAKVAETVGWMLTATSLPDVDRHEELVTGLRRDRPDLSSMTDRQLVEHALELTDDHLEALFEEHIFIGSAVVPVPVGILTQVCTAIGRPEATMRLLAGLGDIESAKPSIMMWELGRRVAASGDLTAIFDGGIDGLEARLRSSAANDVVEFNTAFDSFLYSYGSRGPNEWEQRCPTWETDPSLALAAIDRMRLGDESMSPTSRNADLAAERVALRDEIAAMLESDPETQGMFLAAVQAVMLFVPGRERTKTNCVKLIQESRVALYEYGRRRAGTGDFPNINSFALLGRKELLDSVDHPERYLDELVEREQRFEDVTALQEPFIIHGEKPAMADYHRRDAVEYEVLATGDVLAGLPGCPGSATGIARIVTDAHDPSALEPGDILVAPITDPSWTPLFVPAAAVVVDVGAPLSHAIIVSRELGVPCVVSATDATKRIPDGATIEVNGDTGTVTVLAVP